MNPEIQPRMTDLSDIYRGRTVTITGGLGFIGSNLAHRLIDLDARVRIVDALLPACGGNLFNIHSIRDKVDLHIADVGDAERIDRLVQGSDFIFNLAGHVSHTNSLADPHLDLHLNCHCSLALLEACRRHNPSVAVLFAGTRGQYGRAAALPVFESHPLNPIDVNGVNKLAAEMYHLLYHRLYGLRTCSLRLTNTFGPRHLMRRNHQGFLNWFIRLAMDDQAIPVYGEGAQLRDFNYVDDVVEAMLLALASESAFGHAFNLGGDSPLSVVDSALAVVRACGTGGIQHIPFPRQERTIEVGDYWADSSAFRSLTGWRPALTFDEGLRRTVAFYRQHRQHYWDLQHDPVV
ncbi:MAG: NAD-dependent epimerase/dehydratase family protein [Planctomycetota bacterium]